MVLTCVWFLFGEYGDLLVSCCLIGEVVKVYEDLELWDFLAARELCCQRTPQQQMDDLKRHDEEDSWSMTSSVHSTAASVRTIKSKLTVPVAPSFRSSERLARRKEFYEKLDEKHKALEAEKQECAARTKEEEEAAIKQLRKNMAYKANPVPSFYHEGPPPKAELKKLPVTRAKSPNFTRRKSTGDAVTSQEEKKDSVRATRHSIGAYREYNTTHSTPKKKDQISGRINVNGNNRVKATGKSSVRGTKKTSTNESKEIRVKEIKDALANETKETPPVKEINDSPVKEIKETSHNTMTDQPRADIAVQ
nr:protein WVD2-like 2 [Ipomoea batatas]